MCRSRLASATSAAVVLLVLAPASSPAAQVIEYRAGSSSLYRAHGGSMILHGSGYTARADVGVQNDRLVGFFLEFPYRRLSFGLGDQTVPFTLPTDLVSGAHITPGRGASVRRKTASSDLLIFGGANATGVHAPFFQVARAEQAMALLSYERVLGRSWRWTSRTAIGVRQTALNGLAWAPAQPLSLAVTGGIGSNDPYRATSMRLELGRLALRAGYTRGGSRFRRMPADLFTSAESDRENLELELVPWPGLRVRASRRGYEPPAAAGTVGARATVTGTGIATSHLGFQLSGSLYRTQRGTTRTRALALTGSRRWLGFFSTSLGYYRSRAEGRGTFETVVVTLRETLSPGLGLTQVVTRSGGQTTAAFGGLVLANRVTVDVDYQTLFLPLAPGGQSQFRQALLLTLRLPIGRDVSLTSATRVNDVGEVGYTTYATGYAYVRLPGPAAHDVRRPALHRNVIRGRVVDEHGKPVPGAALRVGGELVFSDSQGMFLVRVKSAREYQLEVALTEFMFPGAYEVVTAPTTVRAAPEESVPALAVVLRRVR